MKNLKRLAILAGTGVAILGGSVAVASPAYASGIRGATVYSDSTFTASNSPSASNNSSAVVSLGKIGRVELRAGDSVKQIAAGNQDTAG